MAITRGPFDLEWGDNLIENVETADIEYTNDEEDINTLQGVIRTFDGSTKVTATITLIGPDIAALAALLPQHFVANGEVLSTGETVQEANGAIDMVPRACDEDLIYNNFDITSCANPGQVFRINNARTKLSDVDFTETHAKYMIRLIGEPAESEATIQVFTEDAIATVS